MKDIPQKEKKIKNIVSNRKARHEYEVILTYEAGIALQGTEVKSLRANQASLQDSYCKFQSKYSNDLLIINFHINPYKHGTYTNHIPKRERKLLLNFRELKKIRNFVLEKNYVLIPLSTYFSGHLVKIELGICRPKKKYDKREAKKEKDNKREIDRKFKFR